VHPLGVVAAAVSESSKRAATTQKSCLQNQNFVLRSCPDGGKRNAGIESNEPSFVLNRENKQVYGGQLPRHDTDTTVLRDWTRCPAEFSSSKIRI
jgi:hypothetical protein